MPKLQKGLDDEQWMNILKYLCTYEQCIMMGINVFFSKLVIPINDLYFDMEYWKINYDNNDDNMDSNDDSNSDDDDGKSGNDGDNGIMYHSCCTFDFANNNIKEKILKFNLSANNYNVLTNDQRGQLLYYMINHYKLSQIYVDQVESILNKYGIDHYSGLFYKYLKHFYYLDLSENGDEFGINGFDKFVLNYFRYVKTDKGTYI